MLYSCKTKNLLCSRFYSIAYCFQTIYLKMILLVGTIIIGAVELNFQRIFADIIS
jgi:hypothetical protein